MRHKRLFIVAVFVILACFLIVKFDRSNEDSFDVERWLEGTWTKEAELVGPDGYVYSFMDFSFLQGQTMTLVREREGEKDTYEELGSTNGDSPRSWTSVIRPAGASDEDYGQLYLSPTNNIVGIRYSHKCYFTYGINSGVFHGHGDVETTSPFILLDAHTKLHEPDVLATILEVIKEREFFENYSGEYFRESLPGSPIRSTLTEGQRHPNKDVVTLSNWLIAIHEKGMSEETDEIIDIIDFAAERISSNYAASRSIAMRIPSYFNISYAEKVIPYLEKILFDPNSDLRSEAAQSLGRMGTITFPILHKCLESDDMHLRFYGLLGFRSAGSEARSELQEIESFLNDKDASVRQQAELAIEEITSEQ
jgi:hypothetical protein